MNGDFYQVSIYTPDLSEPSVTFKVADIGGKYYSITSRTPLRVSEQSTRGEQVSNLIETLAYQIQQLQAQLQASASSNYAS